MRTVTQGEADYPSRLCERLGDAAPAQLTSLGNFSLLQLTKTALFSSARCPGHAVLRAYDQAAKWRDEGRCIIGGFHSPMERECLSILLRGKSPVILCPARGMPTRLSSEYRTTLDAGRMLLLSIFTADETRVTTALAERRNEFVAALADELWFAHITPGGKMEKLVRRMESFKAGDKNSIMP